jgi:hypothetical protein
LNLTEILKILFWILVVAGTVFAFTKNLKRLFQVTGGLMLLSIYNNLWDIGIWPVVQAIFHLWGIIALTILALISNFLVLRMYQKYCKTDWLGITVVDDIVHKADHINSKRINSKGVCKILLAILFVPLWLAKKLIVNKWIGIFILSLLTDGFLATAYYINRKGTSSHFGKSEYIVLSITTVISCAAWSIFTELITLPAFKHLWQFVS